MLVFEFCMSSAEVIGSGWLDFIERLLLLLNFGKEMLKQLAKLFLLGPFKKLK